jgi:hypothetical protein
MVHAITVRRRSLRDFPARLKSFFEDAAKFPFTR